ncbi:MAG TPA: ABC transporter permease [Methylomirabilota bacterium]|jgi:ABC-type spermidine/putrescine transport system permease subunit I|nr:ABC transporter permease [Methylomirabilota bacterium]
MATTAGAWRARAWLPLAPALVFLAVFFVYPLVRMIALSFDAREGPLAYYVSIVSSPVYLTVLVLTFKMALGVTLCCVLLGVPTAYLLASLHGTWRNVLLVAVALPFLTSILIRTYAWMAILGRHGVVNRFLQSTGLTDAPLPLMHNELGVYVGMVHVLLPFMILPVYSVMSAIDRRLLRAAESLGASPRRALISVLLPLALPGIASGALLVFLIAIGFYITPALLGGPRQVMISNLIEVQVIELLNWGFGSALAFVLLAATVALMVLFDRFLGLERLTV